MPPTPFQPSHQTPFKSTLSTSQQSRRQHTPFESSLPAQLSLSDIDPSEWKYHAEGGKNLLLSFCGIGPSPFVTANGNLALRIPKSLPASVDQQAQDQDEQEAELFTANIVTPLLGSASVLPQCIKIPVTSARDRSIIDTLAARIELQRPSARRSHPARIRAEALTCIYAVHDVTAPGPSSAAVLCVEIKPKWGFLPRTHSLPPSSANIHIKANYSRYRMHRVAKDQAMQKHKFEQLYDPLDLYSDDEARKAKALKALCDDWQQTKGNTNNLRLFWNGHVVATDDQELLKCISQFLGGQGGEKGVVFESLTEVLVRELSKPVLPDPASAGKGEVSVLARLAYLQSSLDPYDVEGLASLWLEHTQSPILGQPPATASGALPEGLTSSLRTEALAPLLESFLSAAPAALNTVDHAGGSKEEREQALIAAVQAFLVSATFKDCSLLVRFSRTRTPTGADADADALVGETMLVDLDAKPFKKLASMHSTDKDVCAAFHHWLSTLSSPPAASVQ